MIYLFNQTEELIDVIDKASLAEFTHTIELNQFDRSSFEIPVDYKPNIIKEAQFFGFQSRDRAFCLFRISEKSYDIGLTIQGIDRAESDLHSFIIEDKRPGGTASDVLREILDGTGYQLGNVDGLTRTGRLSFYYISVRQALVKIIESYACEFKIRYTFVENKIIGRYIDLNQRFGRVTGHQFEYGSNILNVTYEESSDEVVTALIGRGKGEQSTDESGEATGGYGRRIQFKDVVWSVSKGDPVDKPAGQNYVANETARNIYGLHQNGEIKHRFGVYTNEDIEDPVELLKATYKELQRLSVPIVTFKANLLDLANAIEQDIWIGDSVGIVRDQIGIAFETRIHKLIIDKLDDNRSVVELGDYQTLQAKDRSTRQQAIKDAVSGFSEGLIEEAIANEVERRNKEFDEKIRVNKLEFDNELQRAKERAEEVKRQISSEIDKKFQLFDNVAINEARRKAEEALRQSGASSLLAQEAKRISDQAKSEIDNLRTSSQTAIEQIETFKTHYGTKLNEFKTTSDGILTKLGAIETYVNNDGQRQESLQSYARDESARQASAIREQISRDYVGKSAYQEDVRGLERRFSAISTQTNNDIASKIAQYKQTVDGQFASITSQIAGKANQTDFQRVQETSRLYERIIGSNENDIADKVARMALTNQLFQVEVAKNIGDNRNYVKNADFRDGSKNWRETNVSGLNFNYDHSMTNFKKSGIHIYGSAGTTEFYGIYQTFKFEGSKNDNVILSFLASKDGANEFSGIRIGIHCRKNNMTISQMWRTIQNSEITRSSYKKISLTFTLPVDVDEINLMFYGEQGKVINLYISEIKFEKGSNATSFTLAPEDTEEAVRSVQSQLAGSWSVQNINSAGDLISGINLGANGQNRITGKLTHITGETLIDRAVIKSAMVDKLKTANFEAGSVTTTILDAEAVTADKVRMDQAFANKLVASNIFTDTLAAKEAFINKLRAVVVSATLLEGYKGWIGGFQLGNHDSGTGKWLTGKNQFSVGMGNGEGGRETTALWVNWGNRWDKVGDRAWLVKNDGRMWCYNTAEFWNTPVVHGNLRVTGSIYYDNRSSGGKAGYWVSSPKYSHIEPSGGSLYLYYSGSGYDWIIMNKDVSDRRYKTNIEDSKISGIDVINSLKTYSYRKEYDGKTTDISCGIMAQDVQKYAPEAFWENPDGVYSYKVFELVPYLIKAIQELNHKIEKLEKIA